MKGISGGEGGGHGCGVWVSLMVVFIIAIWALLGDDRMAFDACTTTTCKRHDR